jgi:NAD-dependent dihydropyrimidine dehydrogenase PreA subunit
MVREMVKIDEDLCNGCGLCVPGCHEGALQIIDGKARLISDLMCDGLGACIGQCPQGAIAIEKREAERYDEIKVMEILATKGKNTLVAHHGGCPGSRTMTIDRSAVLAAEGSPEAADDNGSLNSELRQWPVQMHLINPQAPYYRNADIVIAADCVAYAMGDFHQRHLKGKSLAIACPKLDSNMEVYINKITAMIDHANINTITVMIMQVPCCGGLLQIVKSAANAAQRKVPIKLMVVGIEGKVIQEEWV